LNNTNVSLNYSNPRIYDKYAAEEKQVSEEFIAQESEAHGISKENNKDNTDGI
jgi:hypothetical protein